MEYAVIVAGGAGTRLWPLSRRGTPKQLLTLLGGRSLLQMAYDRAVAVVDPSRILICAGRDYLDVISAQLPDVPQENLLGEPQGRDSLAAITWSTAVVACRDPDATVAVLSADHLITPEASFAHSLRAAFAAATALPRALVTIGVVPDHPETGFGYLHVGAPVAGLDGTFQVTEFTEKPQLDVATRYVADGSWMWNSGMFCWRAATFLDHVRVYQPTMASQIERLMAGPELIDHIYPTLMKTSVDYAIMEPTSRSSDSGVIAVLLDASWADLGSFSSLAEHMAHSDGNASEGRVAQLDSSNNLIVNRAGDGHLIAIAGVENMVVVESGNVTLVCSMDATSSIKELVALAGQMGEEFE